MFSFYQQYPVLFAVLRLLSRGRPDLDAWVDQELAMPAEEFENKYGNRHAGIRMVLEKQVSCRSI